jgi:hypothetical protein
MQAGEIDALLWQSESETLDFKRDQYLFDGATEELRSELLKDILAFANAWRTIPARILIGVQEVKHSRSVPIGTEHLVNRTLQTFVHSKVNRPIAFSYEVVDVDGKSIGVIEIPIQDRPFFLTKKYGKLEANTVFIRRGDTTDTADPDEIAQMGAKREDSRSQPVLEFSFGNLEKRKKHDGEIRVETRCFEVPDYREIPEYGTRNTLGISLHENQDFYADVALYLRDVGHLEPLAVVVANGSRTTAQQVVVRIRFGDSALEVLSPKERRPEPTTDRFGKLMRTDAAIPGVVVIRGEDGAEVEMNIGDIQPGTAAWSSEPFYLGCCASKQFEAEVAISGHNLAEPIRLKQQFRFDVQAQKVSVEQVIALGDSFGT